MAQVIVKFKTDAAAQGFADWLSDQGEQNFFDYQDASMQAEEDLVTEFKYKGMKNSIINITGKV
jgi:hypothetical protein